MPKSEAEPKGLSEALLIAFLSGGSYLFAFLNEIGYTETFKIPSSLISTTLNSVLTFGALFLGGFLILTPAINLVLGLTGLNIHPILKRRLSVLAIILIFVLVEAFLFGPANYQQWIFPIGVLLVLACFDFLFPLITQRKGSYIEKLEAQEMVDMQVTDIASLTKRYLGRDYLALLLILYLGSALARSAGVAEAVRQKEFLVTNSDPPLVILRIYNNNAIASTFNETTRTINNEFSIINLSTSPNLIMELSEMGPLRPATFTPTASPTPTPSAIITTTPNTGTP